MNNERVSVRNPLRLIINTTIFIFIFLLIVYVAIRVVLVYDIDIKREELLQTTAEDLRSIGIYVFDFIRPFLQLVIILVILEWLLNKFGISLNLNILKLDKNVQTPIALVIIVAFALAALSGVDGAGMLKDVALVVVGFYFGTQKKVTEVVKEDTRITTTEEHKTDKE